MFRRHPILSLVTFGYLAVVGWVTLGPQPLGDRGDSILWWVLERFSRYDLTDWITYQRVEFTANVLMFIPVGMFLLLLYGRRWWWASIGTGVVLTCLIEFVQRFLPDRVSDISDIIANSIGTVIGVLVALVVTTPAAIRIRRAERDAAAATRRVPATAGRLR